MALSGHGVCGRAGVCMSAPPLFAGIRWNREFEASRLKPVATVFSTNFRRCRNAGHRIGEQAFEIEAAFGNFLKAPMASSVEIPMTAVSGRVSYWNKYSVYWNR